MDSHDVIVTSNTSLPSSFQDIFSSQILPRITHRLESFFTEPGPEPFFHLETALHKLLLHFGDLLIEQILLASVNDARLTEQAKELYRAQGYHITNRHKQTTVQLYGGHTVSVRTTYMLQRQKKKKGRKRKVGRRGKQGKGVYAALDRLGVAHGASPALQNESTLSALNTPFFEAAENLQRRGVDVSEKRVRTISEKTGSDALKNRETELAKFASGELAQGNDFAGERIVISLDGGRARIRQKKKGRKKNGRKRQGFHTDWREPKLFTLYAIDENGKKKKNKHALTICDGTFERRGHIKQLLKMNLHKTGAHLADSITFTGDGAPWIWNIADEIIDEMGIDKKKVNKVLDFYHAADHLWQVVDLLPKLNEKQKRRLFTTCRRQLKKGKIGTLIEKLGQKAKHTAKAVKALRYFHDHEEKCQYDLYTGKNIPISSGVIESAIRQIVNLRLKGAGMFWLKQNAEAFLHLRCQLKSGNWNTSFRSLL